MQKEKFYGIVDFLLGASWAITVFGAFIVFNLTLFLGFAIALFTTIFFIVFCFFMILALDAFVINRKRLEEAKKQTEFLEKIYAKHTK